MKSNMRNQTFWAFLFVVLNLVLVARTSARSESVYVFVVKKPNEIRTIKFGKASLLVGMVCAGIKVNAKSNQIVVSARKSFSCQRDNKTIKVEVVDENFDLFVDFLENNGFRSDLAVIEDLYQKSKASFLKNKTGLVSYFALSYRVKNNQRFSIVAPENSMYDALFFWDKGSVSIEQGQFSQTTHIKPGVQLNAKKGQSVVFVYIAKITSRYYHMDRVQRLIVNGKTQAFLSSQASN